MDGAAGPQSISSLAAGVTPEGIRSTTRNKGMRSSVAVVTLALLVTLAGCNGLGGADTITETATVTPVSVPTTGSQPGATADAATAEEWPPGLSNGNLGDPVALVRAHVSELDRRSYTVWHTRRVVAANESVLINRTLRGTFSAGERYRVVIERRGQRVTGDGERIVAYSDGQRTSLELSVVRDGDRQLLRNRSGIDMPVAPRSVLDFRPDLGDRLRFAFTAATNATVDRRFSNTLGSGDFSYHVAADRVSSGSAEQSVRNGTLRATIDPNGIVRLYSFSYTSTRNETRVRVHERGGYVNLAQSD